MADPQILTTLRRKRDEIENTLAAYRSKIPDAERDPYAVVATICLFEQSEPAGGHAWSHLSRLGTRGEIVTVCRAALEAESPLFMRELALRVIRAKGLGEGDRVLRKAVTFRIVQALSIEANPQSMCGVCEFRSNLATHSDLMPATVPN